jgi:hypothetical protein
MKDRYLVTELFTVCVVGNRRLRKFGSLRQGLPICPRPPSCAFRALSDLLAVTNRIRY